MRARTLVFAAIAVALAPPIWGFAIEPATLRNEDYEIAPPDWPEGCDGLRVAVLSDLHVGSPWNGLDKLDRIVALTQHADPDLILLGGDYVRGVRAGRFVPPNEIAAVLRQLSAPLGVWAVLGNHDWWFGAPSVRAAFDAVGIPILEDNATRISRGACSFWLAGISDLWESRHDIAGTLAQITDSAPVLAFTHNPDLFPDIPARISLTIAGHTHGGQVYIPFWGRPVVPSRYGERYAIGHVVEGGRHLFVSPGLGTSIIPVRFLVPPEVSLLTLRASDARTAGP